MLNRKPGSLISALSYTLVILPPCDPNPRSTEKPPGQHRSLLSSTPNLTLALSKWLILGSTQIRW